MQNIKELKNIIEEKVMMSKQVFIVSHDNADFDALASAIGMSLIIKKLERPVYILTEDDFINIQSGIKTIYNEINSKIKFIDMNKYKTLASSNDLLITVDVSKEVLICCKNNLSLFKDIILIDHHNEGEKTIDSRYKYIDSSVSSASEIITELLTLFDVEYDSNIAKYLFAGIFLDTNGIYLDSGRYTKNASSQTLRTGATLLEKGADVSEVKSYFEEDFISDRKVQRLVDKTNFINNVIAICIADENTFYMKEELAKVADYLLRYKIDAAFAMGQIENNIISISARSKGKIDVGKIMLEFGGGGNLYSSATKINNANIKETSQELIKVLKLIK